MRYVWLPILLATSCAFGQTLTADQESALRVQIADALFIPKPSPAVDAEAHGSFEVEPGVIAERVSYATQLGMRVPAILYRPAQPQGRIPALIVVNGHGGDKFSWYPPYAGVAYARAGAAVLTYDPIGEGERNAERKSGTRAHDKLPPEPELGRRMGGLMMTDLMQAVSYLREREEIDPDRIAATGYSMGSFVVALTAAVDERLRAAVLVGGGNLDGPGGYWDGSKPLCQGLPYQALQFLGDRAATLYALHSSRGRTLILNGLKDTVVAIPSHGPAFFEDLRGRTLAISRRPDQVFDLLFEPDTSHRPYFVTKPAALWFESVLDFPEWTEESIREMPTTRIGDWAATGSVEMDPLYSTEEREGGTPAIGTGVPALTRPQLSVFSDAEWETRKNGLILEGWLERVGGGDQ